MRIVSYWGKLMNNKIGFPYSPELQAKIAKFKEEWYQEHKKVSNEPTPTYDGNGKQIVKRRPDGKDYVDVAWLVDRLNKHFPGWSWEAAAPLHFLGAEWVVAQGHLCIVDEKLLAFGINPPIRKYYGVDSTRIQYKKDSPHTPDNIIDVGDNCQSANTLAMKRAINRLCGISDDVYGKRVEGEGAGTIESGLSGEVEISVENQARMFGKFLQDRKILVSQALTVLSEKLGKPIIKLSEIEDYQQAYKILVAWKEGGEESQKSEQPIRKEANVCRSWY